jgi:hypothetical protein
MKDLDGHGTNQGWCCSALAVVAVRGGVFRACSNNQAISRAMEMLFVGVRMNL